MQINKANKVLNNKIPSLIQIEILCRERPFIQQSFWEEFGAFA
jgi:hypothetical protein